MAGDQAALALPAPDTWTPPKGKHACGRDFGRPSGADAPTHYAHIPPLPKEPRS